jgi:hypothetical protein
LDVTVSPTNSDEIDIEAIRQTLIKVADEFGGEYVGYSTLSRLASFGVGHGAGI